MTHRPALARRLGLTNAVLIGLGSMIGAGVFAAFTPAAQAAGSGLLVGLGVAAAVAFANATSSAQLAAVYPSSGGTYLYGRERLGEWWGFVAGWCFVIGKIASVAAVALTFAAYSAPDGWQRPVAVGAVVALAAVNYFGVTRTALATRILVIVVLLALAVATVAGANSGSVDVGFLTGPDLLSGGAYGILQSAGILFFAFAGYARIATLGEEVRAPERTIPRAIMIALGITVVVYAVIGVILLAVLGPEGVASSSAPVSDVARAAGWPWVDAVVRIGAAAATLGALLALMAGIGRTVLAMAREGDLPRWLSAVHPRYRVPHHAEVAVTIIVCAIVLLIDLRGAIAFSSFGVLIYYVIANVAAHSQPREQRRYPKALQVFGAIACGVLVATLPPLGIVAGVGVVAVGVLGRAVAQARR